jgi:hypothetical protein
MNPPSSTNTPAFSLLTGLLDQALATGAADLGPFEHSDALRLRKLIYRHRAFLPPGLKFSVRALPGAPGENGLQPPLYNIHIYRGPRFFFQSGLRPSNFPPTPTQPSSVLPPSILDDIMKLSTDS